MSKRHRDAIAIQGGACNPTAIALSIVDACREIENGTDARTSDAAVRLMVHQLAYITRTSAIDSEPATWSALMAECEAQS